MDDVLELAGQTFITIVLSLVFSIVFGILFALVFLSVARYTRPIHLYSGIAIVVFASPYLATRITHLQRWARWIFVVLWPAVLYLLSWIIHQSGFRIGIGP